MSNLEDLEYLAKTIYAEAGGEPFEGQIAVAYVVTNRAKGRNLSIRSTVLQPWQFSCWNFDTSSGRADPGLKRIATCNVESLDYLRCMGVAALVLTKTLADPTSGATHYHTIQKPASIAKWPPSWAEALVRTVTIGNHIFYKS